MPELLLYLLKVNVALVLFYLAYHIALRRLTFYHLNRLFLVFGILFSTVYPFIDLSGFFQSEDQLAAAYLVTIPTWAYTTPTIVQASEAFDFWQIPIALFWLGVVVMLARFIVQLVSLYKIHAFSEPANYKGISFRKVDSINQAFSFWQTIYLNPSQHRPEELESILKHELIHITGWHTLDVLLAELSIVFYWFNPGAWLMKKSVKENLEFIADQNVVNTGVDKKEYQYLLLKVVGATQPQIANQFNFPSLKRRIAMMNKKPTRKENRLRLLIALPLAATLLFAFRNAAPITETIADTEINIAKQTSDNGVPKELIKHLKQNRDIKSVRSKKIDGKNALVLSLRGGGTEVYFLTEAASVAELERRYGLPELPPPPPVPASEQLPAPPPPVKQDEAQAQLSISDGVVYYLDGKEDKAGTYKTIDPKQIHSVNIYKGESAQKITGSKETKGVVSIITKQNKDSGQVKEFEQQLPSLPAPPSVRELSTPPPPVPQDQNEPFIFLLDKIAYYKHKANWPADYEEFLKRNPNVKKVGWKFSDRKDWNLESIVVYLKSGKTEVYDYNKNPKIPAAEAKYGTLPQLPPPPPPVMIKKN